MNNIERTIITAILLFAPTFASCASFQKIIQASYPGFRILSEDDFEPYVLHSSTSPAIVEGRFRGSELDFAALIRSTKSKPYRNTSEMGFDMKVVVCSMKKPYFCQALMEFDIPGRYQSQITQAPNDKGTLCGPEASKAGMPPELVTITNGNSGIQFLFRKGKFSKCYEEGE